MSNSNDVNIKLYAVSISTGIAYQVDHKSTSEDLNLYQVNKDILGEMSDKDIIEYLSKLDSDPEHTIELAGIDKVVS